MLNSVSINGAASFSAPSSRLVLFRPHRAILFGLCHIAVPKSRSDREEEILLSLTKGTYLRTLNNMFRYMFCIVSVIETSADRHSFLHHRLGKQRGMGKEFPLWEPSGCVTLPETQSVNQTSCIETSPNLYITLIWSSTCYDTNR
jgi:hypothetical protein